MKASDIASRALCTRLDDERTPPRLDRVRGQRFWTGAEIRTHVWFVAEAYVITDEPRLLTFVTTSIEEARRFLWRHAHGEWSRLYVRMRAPLSEGYGMLFEELDEVYSSQDGRLIFHLLNGLVLMEEPPTKSAGDDERSYFKSQFVRRRSGPLSS